MEKTEWWEAWHIENGRLRSVEAAVSGSGAGMEPPPHAVLVDGEWRYQPDLPPLQRLTIANSGYGGGYRLCWNGACHSLASLLPPGDIGAIDLYPCDREQQ
jgi:hypothetical protein